MKTFCLVTLILGTSLVHGDEARSQLHFWQETLQSKNLVQINSQVSKTKMAWPPVFSRGRSFYENEERRQSNVAFTQLARDLCNIVINHANGLDDLSGDRRITEIDELLTTRDLLANAPSYQNYVLVDTINRHVFVRLLESLRDRDADPSKVLHSLKLLSGFRFEPMKWKQILESEKGLEIDADAHVFWKYERSFQQNVLERAGLRNHREYHTKRLLDGTTFAALAWRMVVMDYHLRSVVPMLVKYWEDAENPAVTDGYPKIRSVLGKDTLVPASIGAEFLEHSRASAAVFEIFEQINNQKIRGHIAFVTDAP